MWSLLMSLVRRRPAGARVRPATLADMEGRLDGLLATRIRALNRLPPDIAASFTQASTKANSKLAMAWCRAVGVLNMPAALFDLWVVPPAQLRLVLLFRAIITVSFVASALYLGIVKRHAGWCVILPTAPMVLMACIDGCLAQSGQLFIFHMTMGITIAATGIVFLPLRPVESALLTGSTVAIFAGMLCIAPLASWAERAQMITFYGSVLAALLEARFMQNRYQYRLFLLQARDELRASQITQRNKQLSSIAYIDRLTNIPNRRYFDEFIETIHRTPEMFMPLAVCLIDIDHFKSLNDSLGHLQGDHCLALVAGAIRGALRAASDILARFGGEEFVLLLPRTELAAAQEVAERIRLAVLALGHPNPGTLLGCVSISVGLHVTSNLGDMQAPLLEADKALYRAKMSGRNKVSL